MTLKIKLNPFEYAIASFLDDNKGRDFTIHEIADECNMNVRTADKYCEALRKKKLIHKRYGQTSTYYYMA